MSVTFRMPTAAPAHSAQRLVADESRAVVVPVAESPPAQPRPTDAARKGRDHVRSAMSNVHVVSIVLRASNRKPRGVTARPGVVESVDNVRLRPLTAGQLVRVESCARTPKNGQATTQAEAIRARQRIYGILRWRGNSCSVSRTPIDAHASRVRSVSGATPSRCAMQSALRCPRISTAI